MKNWTRSLKYFQRKTWLLISLEVYLLVVVVVVGVEEMRNFEFEFFGQWEMLVNLRCNSFREVLLQLSKTEKKNFKKK